MNKIASDYSNSAILLNILRAKSAEPLNFVSLTAFTGHGTAQFSIGLPSVIIGPGRVPAQNLFIFAPNNFGGNESTDFNVGVLDDPQSIAALSQPVDPATIGYLINEHYNRTLLFFLIISRIDVVDTSRSPNLVTTYINEPFAGNPNLGYDVLNFSDFYDLLWEYIHRGLTVMVDLGYVPQPGNSGAAEFCFDRALPDPTIVDMPQRVSVSHTITCRRNQANLNTPPKISTNKLSFATADKPAQRIQVVVPAKPVGGGGKTEQTASGGRWSFPNPDNPNQQVQIYTRSVYGMYRYLGELANLQAPEFGQQINADKVRRFEKSLSSMLVLTHGTANCFAAILFEGLQWCIPADATPTKRVFQILHLLFRLYASPGNQTVTPTFRPVGS